MKNYDIYNAHEVNMHEIEYAIVGMATYAPDSKQPGINVQGGRCGPGNTNLEVEP